MQSDNAAATQLANENLVSLAELSRIVTPTRTPKTIRTYATDGVQLPDSEERVYLETLLVGGYMQSSVPAWKRFLIASNGLS